MGLALCGPVAAQAAEPLVPGTGRLMSQMGDDFEDENWTWNFNWPKVYNKEDEILAVNAPYGRARNNRWYEGPMRGQPDVIRRVETPEGGLPGSRGALLLKSLRTGYAGRPSYTVQQDDLIASVAERFGKIPVGRQPSVVVRVYLPPVEEWENRTGCHFAFRLSLETHPQPPKKTGFFSVAKPEAKDSQYWPGIFIDFQSKEGRGATRQPGDSAVLRVRANNRGGDVQGPYIEETGWWTLGMSVTADGMVHFFARPGVEDLTAEDHITSSFPYGRKAIWMETFFFDVLTNDDNKVWSSEWIIDDPRLYLVR